MQTLAILKPDYALESIDPLPTQHGDNFIC